MFYENSIWINRNTQVCEGDAFGHVAVGQSGTLQFSEVFLAEFLRLQELGVVDMEKDSAEAFVLSVIDSLKVGNKGYCDDIDKAYGIYTRLPNYSCCSLVESPSAISRISKVSQGVRAEKVSAGKIRLRGVPFGAEVSVFDLNGKLLLRKNFDGGFLEIPNVPAVVRVHENWLWMR